MAQRLQVFVSSKMQELAAERQAVRRALDDMKVDAFVFEADAGARAGTIRQTYLDEIDKADLYVGLFWKGYGDYTIDEYEHARRTGKDRLIYEKRDAIEERDPALEAFLNKLGKVETGLTIRWFHKPDELVEFIKQDVARWQTDIVRRAKAPGGDAPFQAPPRSDKFVDRPGVTDRLKRDLLPDAAGEPPRVTRAVLHGAGGSGKTSIAVAFAHDAGVRRQFPDGVLWASLGQTPDLLQHLSAWGRALKDPQAANLGYPDVATATSQLRTLLLNRACLLLVDDAWEAGHVKDAFLVGGPACLLVVTTRQADIGTSIGAETIPLEGMSEDEAMALFEKWAGTLTPDARAVARLLAQEVGYLPLALELIGAQVGRLGNWDDYRARWNDHRLGALRRGRRAAGRDDSIIDSIELSVNALAPDDRDAYMRLAVFDLGATFPASAAAAVWGCHEADASDLLHDLAQSALLGRRQNAGRPGFTFHSLLHEYVTSQIGVDGLRRAHEALLDGYARRGSGDWCAVPDDGYFAGHLTAHLASAGRRSDVYALIDRPWMLAQFARRNTHRLFAADVERAIDLASREKPTPWTVLVRGCQAAASLRAAAMPATLLELLARMGEVDRALEAAALVPDPRLRSRAYRAIGTVLLERGAATEAQAAFELAIGAADAESFTRSRAEELVAVVPLLHRCGAAAEAPPLAARAEGALAGIASLVERSMVLDALAPAYDAIDRPADAARILDAWQAELQQAAAGDAESALPNFARAMKSVSDRTSAHLEWAEEAARNLLAQGRGEWAASEVAEALCLHGRPDRAASLVVKIASRPYLASSLLRCAEAHHRAGDAVQTRDFFDRAIDVFLRAEEDRSGLAIELIDQLCRLAVDMPDPGDRLADVERLCTRMTTPSSHPGWEARMLALLALAHTRLRQTARADELTARVVEILTKPGADDIGSDGGAAVYLARAGRHQAVEAIAAVTKDREAVGSIALALFEQGAATEARALAQRVLGAAGDPARDPAEVKLLTKAAGRLRDLHAGDRAAQLVARAGQLAQAITYAPSRAFALACVADALAEGGQTTAADSILAAALADRGSEQFWSAEEADMAIFRTAAAVQDDAAFQATLGEIQGNWRRQSQVLPAVVEGSLKRGDPARAEAFLERVRSAESDYMPWNEVPRTESLEELAGVEHGQLLDWVEREAFLKDRASRAGVLGRVAATRSRIGEGACARAALDEAMALAATIGDDGARGALLPRLAREVASAADGPLLHRLIDAAASSAERDMLRQQAASALGDARVFDLAAAIARSVEDDDTRQQTIVQVAESLIDQDEGDRALDSSRQVVDAGMRAYLMASVAGLRARRGEADAARAVLAEAGGELAPPVEAYLRGLVAARTAQVHALLGDRQAALDAVDRYERLDWAVTGCFGAVWAADALARLGETARADGARQDALRRAIETVGDPWAQATQIELAASVQRAEPAAAAAVLDRVRAIDDEFARGDAIARLYGYLRKADATAALDSVSHAISELQNEWAQASAFSALGRRMADLRDGEGLSRLQPAVQRIGNAWARSHALGHLASALASGGDPDDFSRCLGTLLDYSLPGWRRAAALGLAARALRRIGRTAHADEVAGEALDAARRAHDSDEATRCVETSHVALALTALGRPDEARDLLPIALDAARRIRSWWTRANAVERLGALVGALSAPDRIDSWLQLCHEDQSDAVVPDALVTAASMLAAAGRAAEARALVERAVAGPSPGVDAPTLGKAAAIVRRCGEAQRADDLFARALLAARLEGRGSIAGVLESQVDALAAVDGGDTLWSIVDELRRVDAW
jgi:tetratricopeptide (TPR) repeat protein